MPTKTIKQSSPVTTTRRSTSAQRAYAAGDVQWVIDLTQSPARTVEAAKSAVCGSVIALSLLTAVVWSYDVSRFIGQ